MTFSNLRSPTTRPTMRMAARLVAAGFLVQAIGAVVIWHLVDDSAGSTFSNDDFLEWTTFGAILGGALGVLAGAITRRWWVTGVVMTGCLLAMALGCALFVGYAVANSA